MKKEEGKKGNEAAALIPMLITTDHTKRGVFAGYVTETELERFNKRETDTIVAEEVRMAVYWSEAMAGVLGLASMGPDSKCRISKAVKKASLAGVTAMIQIDDAAMKKWKKEPWG